MQNKENEKGTPGAMNHPTNEEWMEFLYGELPETKHLELETHAKSCAECARQVEGWRATMSALDKSVLPKVASKPGATIEWSRWALAAAVVLFVGFLAGRFTGSSSRELARLKDSVSQLSAQLELQRTTSLSNAVTAASSTASAETLRLLEDYGQQTGAQRVEDQQAVSLALKAFDYRLDKLDAELATVAVNTQSGFRKTQETMLALASAVPVPTDGAGNTKQVQ